MVTSTCTLGLWLKANVVTQGKGKVAGLRLYFVSAIFLRAVLWEECCHMAGRSVGLQTYKSVVCYDFTHYLPVRLSLSPCLLDTCCCKIEFYERWLVLCLNLWQIINIAPLFKFQEDMLGTKEKLASISSACDVIIVFPDWERFWEVSLFFLPCPHLLDMDPLKTSSKKTSHFIKPLKRVQLLFIINSSVYHFRLCLNNTKKSRWWQVWPTLQSSSCLFWPNT